MADSVNAIFIGGLEPRNKPNAGYVSLSTQLGVFKKGYGEDKVVKAFSWDESSSTINKFIKQNPNAIIVMYSAGCTKADRVASVSGVNKNRIYMIEPYAKNGNQHVVDAVASGVPARNVFVGTSSSTGEGVVKGASKSNSSSHANAPKDVGARLPKDSNVVSPQQQQQPTTPSAPPPPTSSAPVILTYWQQTVDRVFKKRRLRKQAAVKTEETITQTNSTKEDKKISTPNNPAGSAYRVNPPYCSLVTAAKNSIGFSTAKIPNTKGGGVGCAAAVSVMFLRATGYQINPPKDIELGTSTLWSILSKSDKWKKRADWKQGQPGDVIVTGRLNSEVPGHVGIIIDTIHKDGSFTIISNSSSGFAGSAKGTIQPNYSVKKWQSITNRNPPQTGAFQYIGECAK